VNRRRELKTQTLAGPRRHDAKHVPAGKHFLDHLALRDAELLQPEMLQQRGVEVEVGVGVGHLFGIIPGSSERAKFDPNQNAETAAINAHPFVAKQKEVTYTTLCVPASVER
jgi:hypothetical protein